MILKLKQKRAQRKNKECLTKAFATVLQHPLNFNSIGFFSKTPYTLTISRLNTVRLKSLFTEFLKLTPRLIISSHL